MAKNATPGTARLLRTSGLGAVAAALAMMALPSPTMAQENPASRWLGTRQPQAQAPQSGGNAGRNWGGRSGGGRNWSESRGSDGGAWRSRPAPQPGSDWARPSRQGRPVQQNEGIRGTAADVQAARAARMAEIQRQRETAGQRQWSGRDRAGRDRDDRNVGRWRNPDDRRWDNDGNRWRDRDGRWAGDRSRWGNDHRWNRDWRRDSRYDWYGYRNNNRHIYRLGRYYAPYRGYSYRPVGVGFRLDSMFFGSRYWLNDPWYYRLPPADGPYRWVRYYDDALLVDIYSGEVIDVINNFFW